MIDQLSPGVRKFVAIGILVLALLVLVEVILMPSAQLLLDTRDELAASRSRLVTLRSMMERLLPDASSVPPSLAIVADNPIIATRQLSALVSGSAAIAGVSLVHTADKLNESGATRIVTVDLNATGPEAGLTTFTSLVEHGSPVIRFRHWEMSAAATPAAPMRLSARVIMAWTPTR